MTEKNIPAHVILETLVVTTHPNGREYLRQASSTLTVEPRSFLI